MSDLPTLSDLPSEQEAIAFATKLVQAYNRGELLTREEAANDPEVIDKVIRNHYSGATYYPPGDRR